MFQGRVDDGPSRSWELTFSFHKRQEISGLAQRLSAQEGLRTQYNSESTEYANYWL
jgi:hypothetical protein